MELNDLYDLIDEENINLVQTKLKNLNGIYYQQNDEINSTIVLNEETANNYVLEKETIAEELGHHFMGIIPTSPFDTDYYNKLLRSINEFRAFKWASNKLIPKDKLNNFIDKYKPNNIYEIAEYFNVSPKFATKVYKLYFNLE